jgi:hypothetical protein
MSLRSQKFKYLEQIKALKPDFIPPFHEIIAILPEVNEGETFILRSALRDEANQDYLLSGKSLSLPNLGKNNLEEALNKIKAQNELQEIILQKQIQWKDHLTVFYQEDFVFVEVKDREEKNSFFYMGELGGTNHQLSYELITYLNEIKVVLKSEKTWLMEWGHDGKAFYLFQLQPVASDKLRTLLSNDLAYEMVQSKERFAGSQNLWAMLKTEWFAYVYRYKKKKKPNFETKDVFLNWEFIFHYFRLFCLSKNIRPDEEGLVRFFQSLQQNHFLANVSKIHFKLANQWRKSEAFPQMNFIGHQKKIRFIGRGQVHVSKVQLVFLEELIPEEIYLLQEKRIILTKSLSLLGHGILAAIEQGHSVVFGIPDEDWQNLLNADQIFLDFENESFSLK